VKFSTALYAQPFPPEPRAQSRGASIGQFFISIHTLIVQDRLPRWCASCILHPASLFYNPFDVLVGEGRDQEEEASSWELPQLPAHSFPLCGILWHLIHAMGAPYNVIQQLSPHHPRASNPIMTCGCCSLCSITGAAQYHDSNSSKDVLLRLTFVTVIDVIEWLL
jgi:hypothetical protein